MKNVAKKIPVVQITTSPTDGAALAIVDYFGNAKKTNRFAKEESKNQYTELSFGLFGEVGGLLSALKKAKRDQLTQPQSEVVGEEIGDALWYLVNLSSVCGISTEELARASLAYLREYFNENAKSPPARITFRMLEGITSLHHAHLAHAAEQILQQLAKETGDTVSIGFVEMQKLVEKKRASRLGGLLGNLALVSSLYRLNLSVLAENNLKKNADRWPGSNPQYIFPIGAGEAHEQFPSVMEVTFVQRKVGNKIFVVQQINGLNIGDPLTDNSHRPDGYRFHDVFHLSYAVHLGWSPVIRALLKLKRKSDAKIDENEDGARAIIIEEGIATWIFNHSKRHKYYVDIMEGRLEYGLLKQARGMVAGFQIADLPLWQWERSILEGFKVFRQLFENKGGSVVANLELHTLSYRPPDRAER
jgi:NTP pyrophosphatase (non-canonical NTP hydrolase)